MVPIMPADKPPRASSTRDVVMLYDEWTAVQGFGMIHKEANFTIGSLAFLQRSIFYSTLLILRQQKSNISQIFGGTSSERFARVGVASFTKPLSQSQ